MGKQAEGKSLPGLNLIWKDRGNEAIIQINKKKKSPESCIFRKQSASAAAKQRKPLDCEVWKTSPLPTPIITKEQP